MESKQEILVIAATDPELEAARELLGKNSSEVRIAATGAGKVSTALATQALVQEVRPDWIIQVGCAGAYPAAGLHTGDAAT